jgi:hypothetical protein
MYFENFDKIYYDFNLGREQNDLMLVSDITTNVRFQKHLIENVTLWEFYYIKDGERLEHISEKLYGSPIYHWVLMVLNEKYDYINDMPLQQTELERFVKEKYGAGNENSDHHYEDADGFIVNSNVVGAVPVSNYQHEEIINENKRKIKIIAPSLMFRILEQFKELV